MLLLLFWRQSSLHRLMLSFEFVLKWLFFSESLKIVANSGSCKILKQDKAALKPMKIVIAEENWKNKMQVLKKITYCKVYW